MPSHKLVEIEAASIKLEKDNGEFVDLPVDYVVLSLGVKADHTLADEIVSHFDKVVKLVIRLKLAELPMPLKRVLLQLII